MPSLIAYRKVIDAITTHTLALPGPTEPGQGNAAQEIATLADGRTVVVLFGAATLPAAQPAAIRASIETLPTPLPPELRAEICAASPHVRLINRRVQEAIAARYSMADEIQLLRLGPGADFAAYNAYAEACRAAGRGERAQLAL